jgi:hypothetical protein
VTIPRTAETAGRTGPPEEIKAVPVRHPGRWLAAAVVLLLVAMLVHTLVTNPRFQWDIIGRYFLSSRVLDGLKLTILLTVVAMAIGIVLGVILAVMRELQQSVQIRLERLRGPFDRRGRGHQRVAAFGAGPRAGQSPHRPLLGSRTP